MAGDLSAVDEPADPWIRISGLELLEEIGRGGMGVVYRARQPSLGRVVAVKLLLGARFASQSDRERFQREAQAAASLRHPGIIAILDFGETEGTPWFSMEYLSGRTLEQRSRETPLAPRACTVCLVDLCSAVQHAHAHGVLHRDLKPSNILFDADDRPRVADFGIACRFDSHGEAGAALTRTGQTLGSPGYAAPELALGGSADERTDVYGLGAVLYHLLTGRAPFEGPTLEAVLLQLGQSDPIAPSRFNPALPQDLETICLKCLSKHPDQRYGSAADLRDDLERFLKDIPIRARPPGVIARTVKWSRRNPSSAALLGGLLAALTLTAVGGVSFSRREARIEQRTAFVSEASALLQSGHAGSRTEALDKLARAWTLRASGELRSLAATALTMPELRFLGATVEPPASVGNPSSADGLRELVREGEGLVVRGARDGVRYGILSGATEGARVALDDGGQRAAWCQSGLSSVTLTSVADGAQIASLAHPQPVLEIAWSGELIATVCENRFIYIWRSDGRLLHRLIGHDSPHIQIAFRPGGQELASTAADSHVRVWHAAGGVELLHLEHVHAPYESLRWNAEGNLLRARTSTGRVEAFEVEAGRFLKVLAPGQPEPHTENLGSTDLSADGRLGVAIDESVARVWDFETGRELERLPKSIGQWLSARFSPDGSELLTCGWAEPLRSRAIEAPPALSEPKVLLEGYGNLLRAISANGRHVVLSNNRTGSFLVVPRQAGRAVSVSHSSTLAAAIAPDGTWLATSSYAQPGLRVWSLPDGRLLEELCRDEVVMQMLALGEERLLVKTAEQLTLIQTKDWKEMMPPLPNQRFRGLAVTRDGTRVATGTDVDIRILETATWTEVLRLGVPAEAGWLGECDLAFDADGTHLLAHTSLGTVMRWDLGRIEAELRRMGFGGNAKHAP